MASWDDEDAPTVIASTVAEKWQGEDEEEVLEAWDAEEDVKSAPAPQTNTTGSERVTKKPTRDRLAEKEEKKRRELEEQRKLQEEQAGPQQLTELQRQRMAEEAEFEMLQDTFGGDQERLQSLSEQTLDGANPTTKEEFDRFSNLLRDKITKYERSIHYAGFLEALFRDLVVGVDVDNLRKMSTMFSALATEKQKVTKAGKGKKKPTKGKIAVMRANDFTTELEGDTVEGDEFDDFM